MIILCFQKFLIGSATTGRGTKEKKMKVKKFVRLEIDVNLLIEKDEFFAICEEFGSNFPSLHFEREEWDFLRKFVLGDEKKLSLIQKVIKRQSFGENSWDAEMNIRRDLRILFYEISENIQYIIIPNCSTIEGNKERVLKIKARIFRGQIDPVVRLIIDYQNRLSLEHRDGYIRLYGKLKNVSGWKKISLEEVEISEEDKDYYLSRGFNI